MRWGLVVLCVAALSLWHMLGGNMLLLFWPRELRMCVFFLWCELKQQVQNECELCSLRAACRMIWSAQNIVAPARSNQLFLLDFFHRHFYVGFVLWRISCHFWLFTCFDSLPVLKIPFYFFSTFCKIDFLIQVWKKILKLVWGHFSWSFCGCIVLSSMCGWSPKTRRNRRKQGTRRTPRRFS